MHISELQRTINRTICTGFDADTNHYASRAGADCANCGDAWSDMVRKLELQVAAFKR